MYNKIKISAFILNFKVSMLLADVVSIERKVNFFKFDAAYDVQYIFQDSATPVMEGITDFHHDLFAILVFVCLFVFYMLVACIIEYGVFCPIKNWSRIALYTETDANLEIIWTIIPAFVLLYVSLPSFALLYAMDEVISPLITLKIVGRQWYWHYECSDFGVKPIKFDSYMVEEEMLEKGQFRLLETDEKIILPITTHIRLLVTAADVLHSWAIPSFGIKLDACPGRLNQTGLFINRAGMFYGQCSEICGVNHGFMPICVVGVKLEEYTDWVNLLGIPTVELENSFI